jgi:hypothetical protein
MPNPAQQRVMDRLVAGLPPQPEVEAPVPVLRVVSHEWGREGNTILFHRFIKGLLAPELYRIYADGRTSRH